MFQLNKIIQALDKFKLVSWSKMKVCLILLKRLLKSNSMNAILMTRSKFRTRMKLKMIENIQKQHLRKCENAPSPTNSKRNTVLTQLMNRTTTCSMQSHDFCRVNLTTNRAWVRFLQEIKINLFMKRQRKNRRLSATATFLKGKMLLVRCQLIKLWWYNLKRTMRVLESNRQTSLRRSAWLPTGSPTKITRTEARSTKKLPALPQTPKTSNSLITVKISQTKVRKEYLINI